MDVITTESTFEELRSDLRDLAQAHAQALKKIRDLEEQLVETQCLIEELSTIHRERYQKKQALLKQDVPPHKVVTMIQKSEPGTTWQAVNKSIKQYSETLNSAMSKAKCILTEEFIRLHQKKATKQEAETARLITLGRCCDANDRLNDLGSRLRFVPKLRRGEGEGEQLYSPDGTLSVAMVAKFRMKLSPCLHSKASQQQKAVSHPTGRRIKFDKKRICWHALKSAKLP